MNTQQFDEIAKRTEFNRDKISVDLSDFYERIKKHDVWTAKVQEAWGSVENYVDLLYWMKFEKKYNPTQIKDITGKKSFPRAYEYIGWGLASNDFEQCNQAYDEHIKRLYDLRDSFDFNSPIFEDEEFAEVTKNSRNKLNEKACAFYKVSSIEELIRRMYYYYHYNELSTYEISIILGISQRSVQKLLSKIKLNIGASEAQKRAAQKRDYGKIAITSRHTMANTLAAKGYFGSRAENLVRTLLAAKLEDLLYDEFEVIVGVNTRTIIPPREIDIPVILIERKTGCIYKIAIEVDGEVYHSSAKALSRDANKDAIVGELNWHMERIHIPVGMATDSENGKEINNILDNAVISINQYIRGVKKTDSIDNINNISDDKKKLCPMCGGELIKRVARRGAYAGSEFWGCSNYPRCNYIQNDN